jgi:ABC-type multidrug transport system ATPase subunit
MRCELIDIGKTFQYSKVFRGVNLSLELGWKGAVLGGNGSGKSTLLKIIAGSLTPSEGQVLFFKDDRQLKGFEMIANVAFAAPYIDLIEDFTIPEILTFYTRFKPMRNGISAVDFIDLCGLQQAKNKPIKYFSSGMRQRLKLALAIVSDTDMLLLDEPHSNLDKRGMDWYHALIEKHLDNRIVVIGSNHQKEEYFFAQHEIAIQDFKK